MILVFIFSVGIILLASWLLHGWVGGHALAALVSGRWEIQAEGWAALWPVLSVGLLAGAVAGLAVGLLLSGKLGEALGDKRSEAAKKAEKELHQQRLELSRERAGIDKKIREVSEERIKSINDWAENLEKENGNLRESVLRLQRDYEKINSRLKGAQQKAERFKKKALLMSVHDVKHAPPHV